jgi:hypothetical protein
MFSCKIIIAQSYQYQIGTKGEIVEKLDWVREATVKKYI